MSINTWKKKYYPVSASKFEGRAAYSQLEAAKHCLKKWKGLRQANLMEHHLTLKHGNIVDRNGNTFYTDGDSCALCQWNDAPGIIDKCKRCVLSKARGGFSCTCPRPDEENKSPFSAMRNHNNPEPIIFWLKKAVKLAEERQL